MTDKMPKNITIGDKYGPAMKITDQAEADAYFEKCVKHTMKTMICGRLFAEVVERHSLGYYAGYYDSETRERVERLFKCAHPIFGKIVENGTTSAQAALRAGMDFAKRQLR